MTTLLSMFLILLACGLYGLVHSWLASLGAKALARRWFGSPGERVYRLVYHIFAVISLLPLFALPAILPDLRLYAIPWPWTALSVSIQALAGLALLAGVIQTGLPAFIGLEQLIRTGSPDPARLTVNGLYRRVRHPLYTAGIVILWLSPVMTANLLALNLGLTAYLVIGAIFEERKMVHEFGEAYREYRRRTPMFIPKLF